MTKKTHRHLTAARLKRFSSSSTHRIWHSFF